MAETRIGRVTVASLHQAIADILPQRLEFYENWFNSHGLSEGVIGLAPFTAVVSFLRTEGRAYDQIVWQAGEYAADWSVAALPPMRRRWIMMLPAPFRSRAALAVARDVVRKSYIGSRAVTRVRRHTATLDFRGSLFCNVRSPAEVPLCGYYAAVAARVLKLFQVPATARATRCRAVGDAGCEWAVALYGKDAAADNDASALPDAP